MSSVSARSTIGVCAVLISVWAPAADLQKPLAALRNVGPGGAGHRAATPAWSEVVRLAHAEDLPTLLAALDGANPLAANWIRTAIDAVAERALKSGAKLPTAELESYLAQRQHAPLGRRLAYELLVQADPATPDRVLGGMLDDPSPELRRDAVARLLRAAVPPPGGSAADALATLRTALAAARDPDQVREAAARLRKLGEAVDLARQFGFLLRWRVIGPFDNRGRQGFEKPFPPEREPTSTAGEFPGKHGTVKWSDYVSHDPNGLVDLNRALVEEKEVAGYAFTEFLAASPQEVEFRLTSFNAVKLWLNGKLIDAHQVYHGGSQLDQYRSHGTLVAGKNAILVKVCQNEQTQDWARHWDFQLRVCDLGGTPRLSTDRGAEPPGK